MIRWARTVHSWLCSLFYRDRMGSPEWFFSAVIAGCVCWWFEHAGSWGVWCPASNRTAPSVDGSLELVSFFFLSKPAISLHLDHDLNNVIDMIVSLHYHDVPSVAFRLSHRDHSHQIVIAIITSRSLSPHCKRYNRIAIAITSCGGREYDGTVAKELFQDAVIGIIAITIVNTNCHKVKIPGAFTGMI